MIWLLRSRGALGFDPLTGELRAARASTPAGPVTEPCDTFGVVAGAGSECSEILAGGRQESSRCRCDDPAGYGDCGSESWFRQFAGEGPPVTAPDAGL